MVRQSYVSLKFKRFTEDQNVVINRIAHPNFLKGVEKVSMSLSLSLCTCSFPQHMLKVKGGIHDYVPTGYIPVIIAL